MANIRDILRRTNNKMGEDFETADIIDWFNDCLNEVSDVLFIPASATLTVATSGTFTLPANYRDSLKVYVKDGGAEILPYDRASNTPGYTLVNGVMRLIGYDGTPSVFVVYNRKPAAITNNPEQVPDIPDEFHRIFEHYACAMAMLSDEEHERYSMYNQQYLKVRGQLRSFMNALRSKYNPITAWEVVR
jgi:hypothetical protein